MSADADFVKLGKNLLGSFTAYVTKSACGLLMADSWIVNRKQETMGFWSQNHAKCPGL